MRTHRESACRGCRNPCQRGEMVGLGWKRGISCNQDVGEPSEAVGVLSPWAQCGDRGDEGLPRPPRRRNPARPDPACSRSRGSVWSGTGPWDDCGGKSASTLLSDRDLNLFFSELLLLSHFLLFRLVNFNTIDPSTYSSSFSPPFRAPIACHPSSSATSLIDP